MVMVIECESCQSRFRLAKSLFKESKAIRVRCRKCGGYIVVENPDLARPGKEPPPPPPELAPEPEVPPEPEAPPEPVKEAAPPVDQTARAMAELLREIESEPDEPSSREGESGPKPVPFRPPAPHPEPPDGSEALASALEDLFKPQEPAAPDAPGSAPPAAEPAMAAGPRRPLSSADFGAVKTERPPYTRPLFLVVAVLWISLLAAAAYLFGTGYVENWISEARNVPATSVAGMPVWEISEVEYFTDNGFDGLALLAVTGNVKNVGATARDGVRIQATLVGRDNAVLAERIVFAGNRIDNTMLRHTKRDVVESFLSREAEAGSVNREVLKGDTIPFMAVFYDPPPNIESVQVKAIPAEGG